MTGYYLLAAALSALQILSIAVGAFYVRGKLDGGAPKSAEVDQIRRDVGAGQVNAATTQAVLNAHLDECARRHIETTKGIAELGARMESRFAELSGMIGNVAAGRTNKIYRVGAATRGK